MALKTLSLVDFYGPIFSSVTLMDSPIMDLKLLLAVVGVSAMLMLRHFRKATRSRLPLPPGPKGLPIVGNLFDIPTNKPWEVYDQWFQQYGDIIHVEVLGRPIILLGSAQKCFDLFEKRSSIYSDRIRLPMLNELMGWDLGFNLMRYGSWWRRHRRCFHRYFHPTASLKYRPLQLKESRAFLRGLLDTPDNFLHHVRHAFSAVIMKVTYNIEILESEDPYISTAEESMDNLAQAGIPGTFMVDYIPILKYVPSWFPGAGFKKKAAHWRQVNSQMENRPFDAVKDAMARGGAGPSIAASLIEALPEGDLREEEEIIARHCAAIAYAAGADTTVSTVQFFFLAMAMFPEAQAKAHAELDAVVGEGRFPDFGDYDSLPYILATMRETMRWHLVVPLALAHACTTDDEYDGYLIPEGAIVMGSSWSILHDPKMYPDPHTFNPDRFLKDGKLNPEIRDPATAAFGFGRRICPGRHMSDSSLFAMITSILTVFKITPPVDDCGNPVQLKAEVTTGLLSYPVPFNCVIKPRSSAAEKLIHETQLQDGAAGDI